MDKLDYLGEERLHVIRQIGHIISPQQFFVEVYRNSMRIEVSETLPATSFILLKQFIEDTFGDSACLVVNYWKLSIHIKADTMRFLRANLSDGFEFIQLKCKGVHIENIAYGKQEKFGDTTVKSFKEKRLY